ncbi:hypothetical protein EVAR_92866_1 [Eumeta japonica]|uniref:Uncharacterized protein n=1 Tax=Eumeta variegata TaxID=151549 RepID=A0A4C1TD06_EUMVA|nr:hypothetical protein EVAR_92866_1 [Eumeta japonica]
MHLEIGRLSIAKRRSRPFRSKSVRYKHTGVSKSTACLQAAKFATDTHMKRFSRCQFLGPHWTSMVMRGQRARNLWPQRTSSAGRGVLKTFVTNAGVTSVTDVLMCPLSASNHRLIGRFAGRQLLTR